MSLAPDLELYERARAAATRAYTPYSRFPVGAAVRTPGGGIVVGVNDDNGSYPMTACAERGAVSAAVAQGHHTITAVAVHADAGSVSPCGGCRQILAEHGDASMPVTFRWRGELTVVTLGELLPYAFAFRSES